MYLSVDMTKKKCLTGYVQQERGREDALHFRISVPYMVQRWRLEKAMSGGSLILLRLGVTSFLCILCCIYFQGDCAN